MAIEKINTLVSPLPLYDAVLLNDKRFTQQWQEFLSQQQIAINDIINKLNEVIDEVNP